MYMYVCYLDTQGVMFTTYQLLTRSIGATVDRLIITLSLKKKEEERERIVQSTSNE